MLVISSTGEILDSGWVAEASILAMLRQTLKLELPRCPHCSVNRPNLSAEAHVRTTNHSGQNHRYWVIYNCANCGGAILTASRNIQDSYGAEVIEQYPTGLRVAEQIPERAKSFLAQSQASLHAPAGAVMLAGSAVDAMLKAKGLVNGSLFKRIDEAETQHVITPDMKDWAHEVRLEANDQRHADEDAALPTEQDAQRVLEFALALAEYLFVLPARVKRGRGGH